MKKLLLPISLFIPLLLGYGAQLLMTYAPEYIYLPIIRFIIPVLMILLWYQVGIAFGGRYYSPVKAALIAHIPALYSVVVLTAAQLCAPLPMASYLLNLGPQFYFLPLLPLTGLVINAIAAIPGSLFGAVTIYPFYHYILILCVMLWVFHLGFKKQARKYNIFL